MVSSPIVDAVLRGFQALFGICVLGLSVTLIRGYKWGSLPASLGFTAFVGGFSFLMAVISAVINWKNILQGKIAVVTDMLVALLNVAGGVLMAIKLAGVKCEKVNSSSDEALKLLKSDICCGGIIKHTSFPYNCYYFATGELGKLVGRCKSNTANTVFMWLTFVVVLATATLAFIRTRKGY